MDSPPPRRLRGSLLVASPVLRDPNFARTVVLITEHTTEGAMGLVLNRPLDLAVRDAVPPLAPLAGDDDRVFQGGPVQPEAVMALGRFDDPAASAELVLDDVGFLRADGDLDELAAGVRQLRVFSGYSGWGPGQLEGEIDEDAWLIVPALAEDAFAPPAVDLWSAVLFRNGGAYAMLALLPEDPRLN